MSEDLETKRDGSNLLRQDRLDSIWWGLVFIWGALILLAENAGWADQWSWWDGWGLFFAGAGVLSLIGAIIRIIVPSYRAKWVASIIFGVLFLAIGLGAWEAAAWIWIAALLIVGAAVLFSAFARRP
jgi:hypothetical protein